MRRRSTGVFAKRLAAFMQASASVVFAIVAGCVGQRAPLCALLCGSEAVGQALLAFENRHSLASGDAEVVYFRGRIGLCAGAVFLVTATARVSLASRWLPTAWLVGAGALVLALALVPLLTRGRRDVCWGLALLVSALVLGSACWQGGAFGAAVSQFAYAALLVVGVLSLPPWVAEALNVPVFAVAVMLLIR